MRNTETKWKLVRRKGRKSWVVRYMLPDSSRWMEKTTGCNRKREAFSAAKKIIARAEEMGDRDLYGWAEFRIRYEAERLAGQSPKTLQAFQTAANRFSELCPVETIDQIDSSKLVKFAAKLRAEGKSEATIQAYRDHLMSALKWAVLVEVLAARPSPPPLFRVPEGTKSRGRALTLEEIERMVSKLPSVVGDEYAARWAWNLEALWRSGFRIGETLVLGWEQRDGFHWIEGLDGDRPKIRIDAAAEKGFRNRTIPMTPDFARMLWQVPANKRKGTVFRWPLIRGSTKNVKTIGKRISAIGKAAGVIVSTRTDGTPQFATAHDFRRTFGARWAAKVMPIVLKQLMRHSSIETTLSYYVGADADRAGEAIWATEGAALGDMLDSVSHSEGPPEGQNHLFS